MSPAFVPSIFPFGRTKRKIKLRRHKRRDEIPQQSEKPKLEHVSCAVEEGSSSAGLETVGSSNPTPQLPQVPNSQLLLEVKQEVAVKQEVEDNGTQQEDANDIKEEIVAIQVKSPKEEETDQDLEQTEKDLGQTDEDLEQTDEDLEQINESCSRESLLLKCQKLLEENRFLRTQLKDRSFDIHSFENDDMKVYDFTGLPTFSSFMSVLSKIGSFLEEESVLTPFQQILLTCVKLKFDLSFEFLSYLFGVSRTAVSRTFSDVIHVMDRQLVPSIVVWPEREELRKSMPASLQQTFNKCACIIDTFEVFVAHPKDIKARAQAYSHYKSHNIVKYLIGITPQGSIAYVSKGWGGRVNDKHITDWCGFLENLTPGDVIFADRGFNAGESVWLYNGILKVHAFTKGEKQLDPLDEETSKALASQRFHLERVTGVVQLKYKILQSTIPVSFLQHDQFRFTTLDKIVRVACALTNLSETTSPFD